MLLNSPMCALLHKLPIRSTRFTALSFPRDVIASTDFSTSSISSRSKVNTFVIVIWFIVNVPAISLSPRRIWTCFITADNIHAPQCFHTTQSPHNHPFCSHPQYPQCQCNSHYDG